MELQPRVKRIKVKKPKPPTAKNRLIRFLKSGYISNQMLWQIVILSTIVFVIVTTFLVIWFRPMSSDFKGGVLRIKDGKSLEAK